MGFLKLFQRATVKVASTKKDSFSGWIKCVHCQEMIHATQLQENSHCCPKCDHHYRLSAWQRIQTLADGGSFQELFADLLPVDPLQFVDSKPYAVRLGAAQEETGRSEAVMTGRATVKGISVALGALDFSFMGGSMGSVVGERLTLLIEHAAQKKVPLVIVSSSGGARMQEAIFSLMQMAKTSMALAKLSEKEVPYISVLTNPTTGGVTASFASLGDLILAEPNALIGFAGPRVVEQTIRQKLPESAQKSEFLLEKGMVDCIVRRKELKEKIAFFLEFLTNNPALSRETEKERRIKHLEELVYASTSQARAEDPGTRLGGSQDCRTRLSERP